MTSPLTTDSEESQAAENMEPPLRGKARGRKRSIEGQDRLTPQQQRLFRGIDLTILGERIRRARQESKITQRDLTKDLFTAVFTFLLSTAI